MLVHFSVAALIFSIIHLSTEVTFDLSPPECRHTYNITSNETVYVSSSRENETLNEMGDCYVTIHNYHQSAQIHYEFELGNQSLSKIKSGYSKFT